MPPQAGQPLYDLLKRIRRPTTLREIIALCLRHVYMGDPFAKDGDGAVPSPRSEFLEKVVCSEASIAGLRCVIYKPKNKDGTKLPVMFYMHGGGFVIGCSEDTDYTTRRLCLDNDLVVISINYPLAPETVFPIAMDSCLQVVEQVCQADNVWQVDSSKVFLCGDSAGGNLAAGMALQLMDSGDSRMTITGLVMLAPWLDMHVELYESYNLLAPTGIVFDAAFIGYARGAYVSFSDWTDPLASPIHCSPARLPPTLIIAGTDDPLLDQSVTFEANARQAGYKHIQLKQYEGMPHCFYSFPGLFADEEEDCYNCIKDFVAKSGRGK